MERFDSDYEKEKHTLELAGEVMIEANKCKMDGEHYMSVMHHASVLDKQSAAASQAIQVVTPDLKETLDACDRAFRIATYIADNPDTEYGIAELLITRSNLAATNLSLKLGLSSVKKLIAQLESIWMNDPKSNPKLPKPMIVIPSPPVIKDWVTESAKP